MFERENWAPAVLLPKHPALWHFFSKKTTKSECHWDLRLAPVCKRLSWWLPTDLTHIAQNLHQFAQMPFYKKLGPFYKKLNCETMVTDHRPVRTIMHLTTTYKALKRHNLINLACSFIADCAHSLQELFNFMKMRTFYKKTTAFYKKLPLFIKNYRFL